MGHWKMRLVGLFLILLFAGLLYYNWYMLMEERKYYMKLAWLSPVGIVGGLFILLFPTKAGPPQNTQDRLIALLVFILGMAAGAINVYLMDPGFFSLR